MDYEEFKALVKRMRKAQREFFKRASPDACQRRRDLEHLVDIELDRKDPPSLF